MSREGAELHRVGRPIFAAANCISTISPFPPVLSDLVLDVHGHIVYVEVKAKGYPNKAQKDWRDSAQKRGADYFIVRSIDDMQRVLERLGVKVRARAMEAA